MARIPLDYATPRTGLSWTVRRVAVIVVVGLMIWGFFCALWPRSRPPTLDDVAGARAALVWEGLRRFHSDHGRLPTHEEGLNVLAQRRAWPSHAGGPYLSAPPTDPWGRPYLYHGMRPRRVMVVSVGADGQEGTADDLVFAN